MSSVVTNICLDNAACTCCIADAVGGSALVKILLVCTVLCVLLVLPLCWCDGDRDQAK